MKKKNSNDSGTSTHALLPVTKRFTIIYVLKFNFCTFKIIIGMMRKKKKDNKEEEEKR